jgi:hypothetical protein
VGARAGGLREGCGGRGEAEPIRQPVLRGGVRGRCTGRQEIAGRDAEEARERRQVVDPEVEPAIQKPREAPVAHTERPFDRARGEARRGDSAVQDPAEGLELSGYRRGSL